MREGVCQSRLLDIYRQTKMVKKGSTNNGVSDISDNIHHFTQWEQCLSVNKQFLSVNKQLCYSDFLGAGGLHTIFDDLRDGVIWQNLHNQSAAMRHKSPVVCKYMS